MVENHENTEIEEAMIFAKCCGFAKMPWFYVFQENFVFSQHKLKLTV